MTGTCSDEDHNLSLLNKQFCEELLWSGWGRKPVLKSIPYLENVEISQNLEMKNVNNDIYMVAHDIYYFISIWLSSNLELGELPNFEDVYFDT